MKAVLTSMIPVHRLAVFAEMAWLMRRPELGLLCRAARSQGRRISVEAVQTALPGIAEAGTSNVLEWCRMLGLCDAQGGLTALGEDVADREEAPVPEQGVYDLWVAQHPVIGRRVLSVARLASSRDGRFDLVEPVPFEPDLGRVFRSVVDPKERFLVRRLPSNHGQPGCLAGVSGATCKLRWTLDFDGGRDQWQLLGEIEPPNGGRAQGLMPMRHEPESAGLDLGVLAKAWGVGPLSAVGRWDASQRLLGVAVQGLTSAEIESFRKTVKLSRVEVPGMGAYEDVTVEDVAIGPASPEDAHRWALLRLDRHLAASPGYRSRAELREQFAQLTEGTPLERHAPTLPAHDDLLAMTGREAAKFWSLAAPVDLSPYPVPAEELAALRVGVQAPLSRMERPGIVRVPYRSGWSMRMLVDDLLGGTAPAKVLLCDRYVRGPENLAALRLLVAALRGAGPAAAIEVWTGEEDADFKQIHAITGTQPRSYRQVFGRFLPHDRYMLIAPVQGQGFGWQMSNSPLHARADVQAASAESALRWKDLSATRATPDELEPALRQWFGGGPR